jgi:hypothetical protein
LLRPTADRDLHRDLDRTAHVADLPADLLTYRAAYVLRERQVLLSHQAVPPLSAAEVGVEGGEGESQGLGGDLDLRKARQLER